MTDAATQPKNLQPNWLAQQMARELRRRIDEAQAAGRDATPMELVNALLQLQDQEGHKLVFTRFDLFQVFANWSKQMAASQRVDGAEPSARGMTPQFNLTPGAGQ